MRKRIAAMIIAASCLITTPVYAMPNDYIWPDDVYQMCEEICKPYNISPEFVQAICWQESRYYADADNGQCYGIMQINPKYHKDRMARLGVSDLKDPYSCIQIGTDYLAELFEINDDDYFVLMAYNMGTDKAKKMIDAGKYTDYAEDICYNAIVLEDEHGK